MNISSSNLCVFLFPTEPTYIHGYCEPIHSIPIANSNKNRSLSYCLRQLGTYGHRILLGCTKKNLEKWRTTGTTKRSRYEIGGKNLLPTSKKSILYILVENPIVKY